MAAKPHKNDAKLHFQDEKSPFYFQALFSKTTKDPCNPPTWQMQQTYIVAVIRSSFAISYTK